MKTKLLLLALLALLAGEALDAAPATSISFWASSFFTDVPDSNFMALSGHTTEGDSSTSNTGVSIMPAGAFTKMTFYTFDPGDPGSGATRTATLVKNGFATAATCPVTEGTFTCVWTGNVSFADGDLVNIKITGFPGGGRFAPYSVMTVFTVAPTPTGGRNWPFTS